MELIEVPYSDRLRGERAENIEEAIRYYKAALEVRTCTNFPEDGAIIQAEDWAMLQNELAALYNELIRGDLLDFD